MNPFGSIVGRGSDGEEPLAEPGTFDPGLVPEPGAFLADADVRVLTGEGHLAVHDLVREAFEARGVYDATFGYNLAALNRDRRHPDAGLRYGVSPAGRATDGASTDGASTGDERRALRVEFTPTTPFCPQAGPLATGAFAALNGLDERHDYEVVRVRLATHDTADAINDELRARARRYLESGAVDEEPPAVDPAPD
jgi:hypothetical protein